MASGMVFEQHRESLQAAVGPGHSGGGSGFGAAAAAQGGLAAAARQEAEGGALLVAALLRCMRPASSGGGNDNDADPQLQSRCRHTSCAEPQLVELVLCVCSLSVLLLWARQE